MPILCALVGATGVGKTKFSLALAERLGAEIISLDSRQIYKDFCIGTAQPSEEDRALVPHHLVDFLSPELPFSVGKFSSLVRDLLSSDLQKNYILVGGTGLYLKALTEGLANIPEISTSVHTTCAALLKEHGLEFVRNKVFEMDPSLEGSIQARDCQRLLRALEVCTQTGRRFSEIRNERCNGLGKIPVFWLVRERTNLYEMIDSRVLRMVENGWIDEVETLSKKVSLSAPAWQSLGYMEWLNYINGKADKNSVLELIRQGTRHYAKRQITWFRHQNECVELNFDEKSDRMLRIVEENLLKSNSNC
ncbi:MAG: tRNA (adenosine(37)-N6)-dimethylallyltransferase MiaA [Fibrobacteraceae bacterium]|nr:tRNA (adenosine(37)-N6)-dimethylallyltransferase MiaA [Fibrobacteraceae bacterium]